MLLFLNCSLAFLQACSGSLSCWKITCDGALCKYPMLSIRSSYKILVQRSPSILPSILHAHPVPSQDMHPQTITEPPPYLSVPSTSLSVRPSPGNLWAHFLPSELNLLILVSSKKITFFRSTTVKVCVANCKVQSVPPVPG